MKEKKTTNTLYKCDYCEYTNTNKNAVSQHESECKTQVWINPQKFNKAKHLKDFCAFQHQKVFYSDRLPIFEYIMDNHWGCWKRFDVKTSEMFITLSGANSITIARFICEIAERLKPDEISIEPNNKLRIWFD